MRETHFKPGLLLRRLLALGLVAWLAGLGCVLGCEAALSSAAGVEVREESRAESCAAMSTTGHGCCHRAKKRGDSATLETPSRNEGTAAHCPLSRQTSDPARRVRTNDAPATATVPARSHEPEPGQFYESSVPRPRAHDRGGTYLRCCVFLI